MRPRHLVIPIALALASGVAAGPLMHQARAAVEISVDLAPPPLPVYEQPPLPDAGYMWIPGYWAYAPDEGYYWVPGTWVEPPEAGLLWTPGYWGWNNGSYVWNDGYWGPTVGFYGGVDYGFGYNGDGFYGGRWDHGHFAYNTAAWNVGGAHVANSYRENVAHDTRANRVSFNGGTGGISARPTAAQEKAAHEHHTALTASQTQQESAARTDPRLRASTNHGAPPVAATGRAGDFKTHAVAATNPATATPSATPPRTGTVAKPGGTPTPLVAHPEEHAVTPNAAHPPERNAAKPPVRPEEHAVTPNAVHPPERNAAKPPVHPEEHAVAPTVAHPPERPEPARTAVRPPARPPAAEHPVVAHPTAQPPIHPEPTARPVAAPHPVAPPHPAPAARPAPPPKPEAKPDEKKP